MLLGHPAHREVADQFAALVEHRSQGDAADGWNTVRHHMRKPVRGRRTFDLKLAVIRDFEQTHRILHRSALGGNMRKVI